MSHTHKAVVRDAAEHVHALLLAHDEQNAQRYATALQTAHPGWHVDIEPIPQPALPDGLRPEAMT